MFIGHVGVAFAAKRAHPAPSLGTYLATAQWPDFLWTVFLLLGWETVRIAPRLGARESRALSSRGARAPSSTAPAA